MKHTLCIRLKKQGTLQTTRHRSQTGVLREKVSSIYKHNGQCSSSVVQLVGALVESEKWYQGLEHRKPSTKGVVVTCAPDWLFPITCSDSQHILSFSPLGVMLSLVEHLVLQLCILPPMICFVQLFISAFEFLTIIHFYTSSALYQIRINTIVLVSGGTLAYTFPSLLAILTEAS